MSGAPSSVGFDGLVEAHRAELHAHCYRMLGSVHDADDALQETLVRAWRGAAGLREDSSARAWLFRIASNVCLTELERRRKRVLPHDFSPRAAPHAPPGLPEVESTWIEPYPSAHVSLPGGRATPEASYDQREGVELAFVVALQHLAANQRAVLLLREVLGFSAAEAATMLATSVASINSALQRARANLEQRVSAQTQQTTLRALGDNGLQQLLARYVEAWESCDIDAFAALLVEDASFAMPPLTSWYAPRSAVLDWARAYAMSGAWRWRTVRCEANAQPAFAFYVWDETADAYLPFALNVLTLRGGLVRDVTAFIVRTIDVPGSETYERFPDRPVDPRRLDVTFERFGLPASLSS